MNEYIKRLSELVGVSESDLRKEYNEILQDMKTGIGQNIITRISKVDIDDIALSYLVKNHVDDVYIPELNHVMVQNLLKAIRATDVTGRYFKLTNSYNQIAITPRIIKSNEIQTFAITGKGEIYYSPNFAKQLYILSSIKKIKPPKYLYYYKSNGGFIPDEFIGIDFVLRHELEHYVNADHFYLNEYIDDKLDKYIKEKGIDKRLKNKLKSLYQKASNIAGDLILNSFLSEILPASTSNLLLPKDRKIITGKHGGFIGLTDYIFREMMEESNDGDEQGGQEGGGGEQGDSQGGGGGEQGDSQEGGDSSQGDSQEGGDSSQGDSQEGGDSGKGGSQGGGDSSQGDSQEGGDSGKGGSQGGEGSNLTEEDIDKIIEELNDTLDKLSKETSEHQEGSTGNSKLDNAANDKKSEDLAKQEGKSDDGEEGESKGKPSEQDIVSKIKENLDELKKGLSDKAKETEEYDLSDANSELSKKQKTSKEIGSRGEGKDDGGLKELSLDTLATINPFWQKAIKKLSSGSTKVKDKNYKRLDPRSVGQATGSNLGDDSGILVKPKEFTKTKDKKNLIFVLDTSGSMSSVIDKIMSTVFKLIKTNAKDIGKVYVVKFSSKVDAGMLSDKTGNPIDLSKVKSNLLRANFRKFKSSEEIVRSKPTGPDVTLSRMLSSGEFGSTVLPEKTAKAISELLNASNSSVIFISDSDVIRDAENLKSLVHIINSVKRNKTKRIGVFLVNVPKNILDKISQLKKHKDILYSINEENL